MKILAIICIKILSPLLLVVYWINELKEFEFNLTQDEESFVLDHLNF